MKFSLIILLGLSFSAFARPIVTIEGSCEVADLNVDLAAKNHHPDLLKERVKADLIKKGYTFPDNITTDNPLRISLGRNKGSYVSQIAKPVMDPKIKKPDVVDKIKLGLNQAAKDASDLYNKEINTKTVTYVNVSRENSNVVLFSEEGQAVSNVAAEKTPVADIKAINWAIEMIPECK